MAAAVPRGQAALSSSAPWWTRSSRSWWRPGGEGGAGAEAGAGALRGGPVSARRRPPGCSYQRFASCYRGFYKLQPELTKSIHNQFVSQLQASIRVRGNGNGGCGRDTSTALTRRTGVGIPVAGGDPGGDGGREPEGGPQLPG